MAVHTDKSVEVRFKTNQVEEIKRFCLGQGATVRVLEPPELLQAVQKEIEKILYTAQGDYSNNHSTYSTTHVLNRSSIVETLPYGKLG